MGKIVRRPAFKLDSFRAYDLIASDNPPAAANFLRELEKKYQVLADYPEMGTARLPGVPEARIFPYRNYVILYTPLPDGSGIELVRLFGPRQDWEATAAQEFD